MQVIQPGMHMQVFGQPGMPMPHPGMHPGMPMQQQGLSYMPPPQPFVQPGFMPPHAALHQLPTQGMLQPQPQMLQPFPRPQQTGSWVPAPIMQPQPQGGSYVPLPQGVPPPGPMPMVLAPGHQLGQPPAPPPGHQQLFLQQPGPQQGMPLLLQQPGPQVQVVPQACLNPGASYVPPPQPYPTYGAGPVAPASYVPPPMPQHAQPPQQQPPQQQPPQQLQAMPVAQFGSVQQLPPQAQQVLQQAAPGQQVVGTTVHQPVQAAPAQVTQAGVRPGERVRMKGISQGSPYFDKVFIIESLMAGNQARLYEEGNENRVMIMSVTYLEPAVGTALDPTASHGQVLGHTPQWLAQEASAEVAQTQGAGPSDGHGHTLQVGDHVCLKGQSQYTGQVFTVEATDVGDGRVRVSLQLSETAVSRMAFDPAHLDLVTYDEQQGAFQVVEEAAQSIEYQYQQEGAVQGAPQAVEYQQQPQVVEYQQQQQQPQMVQLPPQQAQPQAQQQPGAFIQGQPPMMQAPGYMMQAAA